MEVVVNIDELNSCNSSGSIQEILNKFSDVFKNELGAYKREKIKLQATDNIQPFFCKPRAIPFAFRENVEMELKRLEAEGVIKKVLNSPWGTPLVTVM